MLVRLGRESGQTIVVEKDPKWIDASQEDVQPEVEFESI